MPTFGRRFSWVLLSAVVLGAPVLGQDNVAKVIPPDLTFDDWPMVVSYADARGLPINGFTPAGNYYELARIEYGQPIYRIQTNVGSAATISSDDVWSAPYNLSGTGVTLGIWDGGPVRNTHQEFTGRITLKDGSSFFDDHATHVAGTMIAVGVDASARGMASAARLHSYDWNSDTTEMRSAHAEGVAASNHSYGIIAGWTRDFFGEWYWFGDTTVSTVEDYRFGFYSATAAAWDDVVFDNPRYTVVRAAGNDRGEGPAPGTPHWVIDPATGTFVQSTATRDKDGGAQGYDSIPGSSNAKNVIVVAAVEELAGGYTGVPTDVVMSSFSGWGPTDDGRIKPDLAAKGVATYSSIGTGDAAYATFSGTSMASPAVAGSVGLLLEQYREVNPGLGDPLASTIRALLIHTADEAGSTSGPDYAFGWGLMNTEAAADLIDRDGDLPLTISEQALTTAESVKTFYVAAAAGGTPLKATIAWTDPPGSVSGPAHDQPTSKLVNDLDLRLWNGSTEHQPWVLDLLNPSNGATKGNNTRDNVEQVVVSSPALTVYRLEVRANGSLAGGHQAFSLCISGANAITESTAPLVTPASLNVPEGGSDDIAVRLAQDPGAAVEVALTQLSGSTTITPDVTTLNFDSSNWADEQTVTFTAPTDDDNACDERARFAVGLTSDPDAPVTVVEVTAADDDYGLSTTWPGAPGALVINEGGAGQSASVVLTEQPCDTVAVNVIKTGGNDNINVFGNTTLIFDSNNWNVPQAVTFRSTEDNNDLQDGSATFEFQLATAAPVIQSITVNDIDNDTLELMTVPGPIQVPEGATNFVVNVMLNAYPQAESSIDLEIARIAGTAVDTVPGTPTTLTFDATNWAFGQTLTFSAVEDPGESVDNVVTFQVDITFTGYSDSFTFDVKQIDNDPILIDVLEGTTLDIDEGGTRTFGVRLTNEPLSPVEVDVLQLNGMPRITLVGGAQTLTFTPGNYDTPQMLTVSAENDFNNRPDLAQIVLSSDLLPSVVVTLSQKERVSFARPSQPLAITPAARATGIPVDVTIDWSASLLADSYELYVGTELVPSAEDLVGSTTATQMMVTGLQPNTTYRWRVLAFNSLGVTPSQTFEFTTTAQTTDGGDDDGDGDGDGDGGDGGDGDGDGDDGGPPPTVPPVPCGLGLLLTLSLGFAAAYRRRPRI
jgi:subtilisin family serine protease